MPAKKNSPNSAYKLHRFQAVLQQSLTAEKYRHSLRTAEWAKQIAALCNYDTDAAYLAGLLHDCAKTADADYLLAQAQKHRLRLAKKYRENPLLLHGPLGAVWAREKFGVTNQKILNAIHYHTLGRAGMGKLEKIIYVADYSEPGRHGPAAREIRRLLRKNGDLEQAVKIKRETNAKKFGLAV
ncbi:MAG: bis(5'-nucleosyl)-tetraphosphatase (symmetrical) YqeK [Candidatus Margulisbacteria bacterium]|jgi:predicted HD superfamily hydrolase involved in NAD metabolism|nr:bis(5'-nucleosyl)-tetraphosphatase (symmetrical) YqeK [Candidatus Margulisiibacteriota bacterium]